MAITDDPELIFVSDLGNSHLEKSEFLARSLELSKLPIVKDGKTQKPEDSKLHAEGYINILKVVSQSPFLVVVISIYIRTVNSKHLLFALLNWFNLV